MERGKKMLMLLFAFIFIVGIFYVFTYFITKTTGYNVSESQEVQLAQCLSGKDAIFYISEDCEDCENQKNEFKSGWKFLEVKECGSKEECDVLEFPVLEINEEKFYRFQSLEEIKEISGC